MPLTQVQGGMLAGSTNTTTTIQSNGTTAITIDSSQNVGIGTTTPTNNVGYSTLSVNSSTNGGIYEILKAGTRTFLMYNPSGSSDTALQTEASNALRFNTNGSNERMRIDSSGNLFVGTTTNSVGRSATRLNIANGSTQDTISASQSTNTQYVLASAVTTTSGTRFHIGFSDGTTWAERGTISTNGTNTTYATSSDYRLKENIVPMKNALDTVKQLKPCLWTWKENGSDGQGFIAHELQTVVPDAVVGEKDGLKEDGTPLYQQVDTSFLVATLTAAIQELKAELDATKAEVAALKAAP